MSFVLKSAYLIPRIAVPAFLSFLFACNIFFCPSCHFQSVCLPCTKVGLLQTVFLIKLPPLFFQFMLEYSRLTVLYQVYSKVIQLYIYMYLFQIIFLVSLLKSIEQSFMCCTVGACWLSVLNTAVCTCQSKLTICLSLSPFLPGQYKFILFVNLFLFCK